MAGKMISYAQNFEDVILDRAFEGCHSGIYVDVGAFHPTTDSVTKHFYDKGWSGINIEPDPVLFSLFPSERPRDFNLQRAVSNDTGTAILNIVEGGQHAKTGLSTLHSEEAYRRAENGFNIGAVEVECAKLSDIFKECFSDNVIIDFLKVDVEGFEKQVLLSHDWVEKRPRVVLLEAVKPSIKSTEGKLRVEPCHQEWEYILLAAGYEFAFFDGLNRYYVRVEDSDLIEKIAIPANFCDNFVSANEYQLEQRLKKSATESKVRSKGGAVRNALRVRHRFKWW